MSARSTWSAFSGLWLLLCGLTSSVCGEKVFESPSGSGLIQDIRTALTELTEEGRAYLGRVVGEQTVLSVQKVRNILIKSLTEVLEV